MILDVLTKEDCEQVRIWRNQCLEILRTPYPLTKEQQEAFYRTVVCKRESSYRYFAVRRTCEDAKPYVGLAGMGGLTNIEWENSQAEISLIINPEARHKGYGKEAVRLLLDQAFNYMGLQLVYGECYACSLAKEFWEKLLTQYNCRICWLRKGKFWKGNSCETMYFDVCKHDFRKADSTLHTA